MTPQQPDTASVCLVHSWTPTGARQQRASQREARTSEAGESRHEGERGRETDADEPGLKVSTAQSSAWAL